MRKAEALQARREGERNVLLEQYKALIGDVGNIGVRYATANGFYVSVITALTGVLAYAGTQGPLRMKALVVVILVCYVASVVCRIWRTTLRFYGALFGGKFAVLKEMEARLAFPVYAREYDEVYKKRAAPFLTDHEQLVPGALHCFFSALALVALFYLVFQFARHMAWIH